MTKEEILNEKLREKILLDCIRSNHPYGNEISDDVFKSIEGFEPALEAMELYAQQVAKEAAEKAFDYALQKMLHNGHISTFDKSEYLNKEFPDK